MKSTAKFNGQKTEWLEATPEQKQAWSFEKRAGGWIIATRTEGGRAVERKRFYYSKNKQQFFAKLTQGHSLDFFGERLTVTRGSGAQDAASDYTAQFPGKVRKIMVTAGSEVAIHTPLIMVEAMKMEFAIKAGSAGRVVKVLVEEGQVLTPGQKLLDFEEVMVSK